MREPGRLMTAMATPFTPDGSLDRAGADRLARHLVGSGTTSVLVNGTTGESPTLTHDEKFRLLDIVSEALGGGVWMGTGTNSTRESIDLTREAHERGAAGILLVAPYYNRPPQEGLYRHFAAIAETTDRPVMLYNVPTRTVTDILPDTVIRLSTIPNIIGIKEASGQINRTAEILAGARPGFRVYSGDDVATLPILALGGYGVVSVASHLVGRRIEAMIAAHLEGNTGEAARIHGELLPLLRALFVTTSPIPLKCALRLAGLPGGGVRPPLVEASAAEEAIVRRAMSDLDSAVSN
jgi:4-hydroxy-tetrahydrodipicolinate synthase